eukprot:GEMP01040778.1.p1 GENE.GEMP01040778.1~~GEMP01040778.1.p1  ORF type:complete len:382 (+),score=68.69 GEMP01040778.1:78-1148(+)
MARGVCYLLCGCICATQTQNVLKQLDNCSSALRTCAADLVQECSGNRSCVQMLYKAAIQRLWATNDPAAADAFQDAKALVDNDGVPLVSWLDPLVVPSVFVPGYESPEDGIWDCAQLGLLGQELVANGAKIAQELAADESRWSEAYNYLGGAGWENVWVYRKKEWENSDAYPLLTRILKRHIPTRPPELWALPTQEEAVFLRLRPYSTVPPHCGGSNLQVNMHLTLSGGGNATLLVKDKKIPLQDGKVVCFEDSGKHEVINGAEMRDALVVRLTRPDVGRRHDKRGSWRIGRPYKATPYLFRSRIKRALCPPPLFATECHNKKEYKKGGIPTNIQRERTCETLALVYDLFFCECKK